MPRTLSPAELAGLPAILLLGARQSGKSQTLSSWSAQFEMYERSDSGTLTPVVKRRKEEIRSPTITEYIFEIDGALIRVFDVPGEVLGNTAGAELMLGQLLALKPRIAGVIAFAMPPCDSGEVGYIEDRTQLLADLGKELGEVQVVEQLRSVFELVQGFVAQRLRHAGTPAPAIVVQIGFADLVVWHEDDTSRLCELHNRLRPGGSSAMNWRALKSREPVFAGLDEVARSTFSWLGRLRRAAPGVAFQCVPVSNEAARPLVSRETEPGTRRRTSNLPSHNIGASLQCMVDQIEGPRLRDLRGRQQATAAGLAFLGIVFAAGLLYAGVARWAPDWLPAPMAVNACSNVSQPEQRCDCMEVLARNALAVPFQQRLELISPFVAACGQQMLNAMPPKRPMMMGLAAQVELARGAVAPAEFSAARYEAAVQANGRPGTFPGPMPWFPADGGAQVKALQAVQALVEGGAGAEPAKLAEGFSAVERAEFSGLLRVLSGTKGSSSCLTEWKRARDNGTWKSLAAHCGRDGERLPAELQPCYRADAALGYPDGAPQPTASPCAAESACSVGKGLEALLLRAPTPDAQTFANLAARTTTPQEFSQCVGKALRADHSHLLLLRLLGPGSFEDRQTIVRTASEEQWPAVSEWVRREWVVAEAGRRVGAPKGRALPQRLPMLPLKQVAEAACALVDAPAMYAPPTTPIPWREPMETSDLAAENPATHRARAALALLTAAGDGRTPQSAGCEVAAAVALLRLPPGPDQRALLSRLNAALQVFEAARDAPEGAATAAAVARLRCRLGPSAAPSPEIAARFVETYGCGPAAEAGAAQTGNPVATR
jgi:hypothetical protein